METCSPWDLPPPTLVSVLVQGSGFGAMSLLRFGAVDVPFVDGILTPILLGVKFVILADPFTPPKVTIGDMLTMKGKFF